MIRMTPGFARRTLVLLLAAGASALCAAADEKMAASAMCHASTPNGAKYLVHNGSSLEATDADVTIVCPILRDNLSGALQWVDVRHLRPNGGAGQQVSGRVYSCDSTYGGCWQTDEASSDNGNTYTSVFADTSGLPAGASHYFYYRSVLPKGWKLISIRYRED